MGRFLTKLFALMGISLTCVACYGTPYSEYIPRHEVEAGGRVLNDKGKPITDIRVELGEHHTLTNADGEFYISGAYSSNEMVLIDTDGAENLGEFEKAIFVLEKGYNNLGDIVLKRTDE